MLKRTREKDDDLLHGIPDAVLSLIFTYLPVRINFSRLRSVSKRFERVAKHPSSFCPVMRLVSKDTAVKAGENGLFLSECRHLPDFCKFTSIFISANLGVVLPNGLKNKWCLDYIKTIDSNCPWSNVRAAKATENLTTYFLGRRVERLVLFRPRCVVDEILLSHLETKCLELKELFLENSDASHILKWKQVLPLQGLAINTSGQLCGEDNDSFRAICMHIARVFPQLSVFSTLLNRGSKLPILSECLGKVNALFLTFATVEGNILTTKTWTPKHRQVLKTLFLRNAALTWSTVWNLCCTGVLEKLDLFGCSHHFGDDDTDVKSESSLAFNSTLHSLRADHVFAKEILACLPKLQSTLTELSLHMRFQHRFLSAETEGAHVANNEERDKSWMAIAQMSGLHTLECTLWFLTDTAISHLCTGIPGLKTLQVCVPTDNTLCSLGGIEHLLTHARSLAKLGLVMALSEQGKSKKESIRALCTKHNVVLETC